MISTVSISMVLLMLGGLIMVLINAGKLSRYVRERIGFTLVLHEGLNEIDILRLQKLISSLYYVKSAEYIDKETAAKELTEELGEDFTGFLGYNPLYSSIDVKLYAPYTKNDSLLIIEKDFLDFPQVKEVHYQKNLLSVINENVRKISLILLIVSGLMTVIFISLINNTIRISIYSERFIINTMQLTGATHSFIRKPFLYRSVTHGIIGAFIANIILMSPLFVFYKELEGIISANDIKMLATVCLMVILLGILISYLSALFAVNKFLKMKFDELFY
jgi:cell division transport system permease protein